MKIGLAARGSITAVVFAFLVVFATSVAADEQLYFISPKDGETVATTFTVVLGVKGAALTNDRALYPVQAHLLVDVDALQDFALPLPSMRNIHHFDGAETKLQLTLPRGKHTLQLILTDAMHVPHINPVLSEKITVMVR